MAKGIISARPSTNKPGLINVVNEDNNTPNGNTINYVERSTANVKDLVYFDVSETDGMAINIKVIRPSA
jgi:hypothetical protein